MNTPFGKKLPRVPSTPEARDQYHARYNGAHFIRTMWWPMAEPRLDDPRRLLELSRDDMSEIGRLVTDVLNLMVLRGRIASGWDFEGDES